MDIYFNRLEKCHLWRVKVHFTDQNIMQRGDPMKLNFEGLGK